MIFIVCLFAGLMGAAFTASVLPIRTFGATRNAALGLLGGTIAWVVMTRWVTFGHSLGTFILILLCASGASTLLIAGLARLRDYRRKRR